jgi:hypothetical protein
MARLGQIWQEFEHELIVKSFVVTGIRRHLFNTTSNRFFASNLVLTITVLHGNSHVETFYVLNHGQY